MTRMRSYLAPDTSYEQTYQTAGYRHIAGIDEAGRGCWAGPVVAAAVILPATIIHTPTLLPGVDDSKKLTESQREIAYRRIQRRALGVGVGIVPAFIIDSFGIVPATRLAMTIAVLALPMLADALLIDAMHLDLALPQERLIRGDSRSLSIAAASIVAKVTRDHLMYTADRAYPAYAFAQHKGYGTAKHLAALRAYGVCELHRLSYRPVAELVWG
jgi:ribonuclease HII